jgi:tRNA-guanine family transglycosylase
MNSSGWPMRRVAAEARRVQMLALDLRHDAADDAGTDFRVSRKHDGDIAPYTDPACSCVACRRFSRAFIRHLFVSGEILAARLLTTHNLHFYLDLMRRAGREIDSGNFDKFRRDFVSGYRNKAGE